MSRRDLAVAVALSRTLHEELGARTLSISIGPGGSVKITLEVPADRPEPVRADPG